MNVNSVVFWLCSVAFVTLVMLDRFVSLVTSSNPSDLSVTTDWLSGSSDSSSMNDRLYDFLAPLRGTGRFSARTAGRPPGRPSDRPSGRAALLTTSGGGTDT